MADQFVSTLRRRLSAELPLRPDPVDVLRPPAAEVFIVAGALLLSLLAYGYQGAAMQAMNYGGPVLIAFAAGWGVAAMLRASAAAVWTPLFWMRLGLIAYYGLGSLVPHFANDTTKTMMESFYLYFAPDVARFNLVILCFYLSLLLAVKAMLFLMRAVAHEAAARSRIEPSSLSLLAIGSLFLIAGASMHYLFVLPRKFGIFDGPVPATFAQIALTASLSYFLLGLWALKNRSPWIFGLLALVAIDVFAGLLLFNKTDAIFPLVMMMLAFIYARPTLKRALVAGLIVAGFYFAIVPVVVYGRDTLAATYGRIDKASIGERFSILAHYSPSQARQYQSDMQSGWARLSYVSGGSFAINQYDNGQPGDSLRHLFVVWIPRIIYPAKPVITDIGRDFNVAVNGNDTSQSTPGIPAEGYWNFGWPGVVAFALFAGIAFTLWSLYSVQVMLAEAWHLLVVVMLGLRVGLRVDGLIVSDIVGPIGLAVLMHLALTLLNRAIPHVRGSGGRDRPLLNTR